MRPRSSRSRPPRAQILQASSTPSTTRRWAVSCLGVGLHPWGTLHDQPVRGTREAHRGEVSWLMTRRNRSCAPPGWNAGRHEWSAGIRAPMERHGLRGRRGSWVRFGGLVALGRRSRWKHPGGAASPGLIRAQTAPGRPRCFNVCWRFSRKPTRATVHARREGHSPTKEPGPPGRGLGIGPAPSSAWSCSGR